MLTAYDYPTAKLLDEAGIPLILVGDSLGRAMLGYESEIRVTMADMLHHTAAVTRGARHALVIGDMPFLTLRHARAGRRQRGPVPPRGRRPGGQGRGRRPQRADRSRRSSRPASRSWATSAGRRRPRTPRARSGSSARAGSRPGRSSTTRSRSRRPARSRWSSSSCRSSSRPRSRSGSGSRRSGSGRAPGCSGQVQVDHRPPRAGDSWHPKHAKPYADLRGTILAAAEAYAGGRRRRARSPGPSRPSGWTTPCSTRCSAGRVWTPARPPIHRGDPARPRPLSPAPGARPIA